MCRHAWRHVCRPACICAQACAQTCMQAGTHVLRHVYRHVACGMWHVACCMLHVACVYSDAWNRRLRLTSPEIPEPEPSVENDDVVTAETVAKTAMLKRQLIVSQKKVNSKPLPALASPHWPSPAPYGPRQPPLAPLYYWPDYESFGFCGCEWLRNRGGVQHRSPGSVDPRQAAICFGRP